MTYRQRLAEEKLRLYAQSFPCVLVSGARQVGKSTLLAHLFGAGYRACTFDPVQDLYGARRDPDLFLRNNPPPLILDEIQNVPELVSALKRAIDRDRTPGQFLITGSQQWQVMRRLAESLAGRVAILELPSFCLQEAVGRPGLGWLNAWLDASVEGVDGGIAALRGCRTLEISPATAVWRGSFPEVQTLPAAVVPGWMQGYVSTYLQRDVRALLEVRDETQFGAFLGLCAALSAQECNHSQLGRDIGLSAPAAKRWLGVLRGTYQWLEVPAYATNLTQRLSLKPKGYLTDTGLACYLMRISAPEAVQGHPAFGALFETLVILECLKQLQARPLVPALHHYRQHSGTEVDLLIEHDGRLFPIEVKSSSVPAPRDARGMAVLRDRLGKRVQPGLLIYAGREVLKLGETDAAVPFDLSAVPAGAPEG